MDYIQTNEELMERLNALPEDQRILVEEEIYRELMKNIDDAYLPLSNPTTLTSSGFTKENFMKLVKNIEDMPQPKYYFEILANRKTVLSFDSDNPLIIEFQNELKNNPVGSLFLLRDSLGYAYLNELYKKARLEEEKNSQ